MLIVGTPFNTKDALTSNMPKQVTYDCSVAGREQYFFTDLPKGPKNPTLVPEFCFCFFFFSRPYETAHFLCAALSRLSYAGKNQEKPLEPR